MSAHNVAREMAQAETEKPDPGTGEALYPIDMHEYYPFDTGAAGETNTLKDPTKAGMRCILHLRTDGGGNRVVTADTAVNTAGNTIMTFADAGDILELVSVRTTAALPTVAYRWEVFTNVGSVALS